MMIALALLLAAPQDGCISFDRPWSEEDEFRLHQKAGPGLWIGGIAFTSADIAAAHAEPDPVTEEWAVVVHFSDSGKSKFLTAQRCGVNRPMELSFDRKLVSRPVLLEEIHGGVVQISGGWGSRDEVEAFVRKLSPKL